MGPILRPLQRQRVGEAQRREANVVAGLGLACLPQFRLDDGHGTDEPPRLGPSRVRTIGMSRFN
jgi:hypothetical protein